MLGKQSGEKTLGSPRCAALTVIVVKWRETAELDISELAVRLATTNVMSAALLNVILCKLAAYGG